MTTKRTTPLDRLKYHVSGAIERGEGVAITALDAPEYTPMAPGPWYAEGAKVKSYDHGRGHTVADCHNVKFTQEAQEAHARLIAAAPEQNAELVEVEKLLEAYVNHEPVEMCAFAERLESVRAVIAKVTKE